jgi:REP-associated tyrosine transposase
MSIPHRGNTGYGTYFITASSWGKQHIFQSERMAGLLQDVFLHYRSQHKFLLHEFVIMPNHIHLLVSPLPPTTLERVIQLIKGGFSFRANRELGLRGEIWQSSYYDRRVRDLEEYERMANYIRQNPVRRGLVGKAEEYLYSSARSAVVMDEVPRRLKPLGFEAEVMQR